MLLALIFCSLTKIIVSGMNQDNRTSTLGQIHSSVHAEIDVASQLINRYIRKKRIKILIRS